MALRMETLEKAVWVGGAMSMAVQMRLSVRRWDMAAVAVAAEAVKMDNCTTDSLPSWAIGRTPTSRCAICSRALAVS